MLKLFFAISAGGAVLGLLLGLPPAAVFTAAASVLGLGVSIEKALSERRSDDTAHPGPGDEGIRTS